MQSISFHRLDSFGSNALNRKVDNQEVDFLKGRLQLQIVEQDQEKHRSRLLCQELEQKMHRNRLLRQELEREMHRNRLLRQELKLQASALRQSQGERVISQEHLQREAWLNSALQEKQLLLKEMHHRTKNNLQIISSLIRMQARRCHDTQIRALLQDSQNRIQSIAAIHEQLCQSAEQANVDFGAYIQSLITLLFQTYGITTQQIELTIDTQRINMSLNTALLGGLIVNELVSNAMKHAFPNLQNGAIVISLTPDLPPEQSVASSVTSSVTSTIRLSIQDNGVGMPASFDWQSTRSLGFQIVRSLVTQLKGSIRLDRSCGTAFHITFSSAED
jgi:two-component sensor histidine kinase